MKNYAFKSMYRDFIYGVDVKVPLENGRYVTQINFDNAATTPPFKSVINEIVDFAPWYSSIHRGAGFKSKYSSMLYDESRNIVADFVGADLTKDVVVYVKNTTEAINKVSNILCTGDCIILSSSIEHHSNDLPWRKNFQVDYIESDECGRLLLKDLKYKLEKYNGKVKLVTITGASNVTGYITPIHEAAKLAHMYGAKILVDGAQLVPHMQIDMKSHSSMEHIDFLAFSAHKMYAPFGVGVLIGPKGMFEKGICESPGGGTVKVVTKNKIIWEDPPEKEEAGTPNIMGVIALTAAIKTLRDLEMENIFQYEEELFKYTIANLSRIPDIELYCNYNNYSPNVSIVPFNIVGVDHNLTAEILSGEAGIAVRNGCFCAHPYVQKLLKLSSKDIENILKSPNGKHPGMVRLSYGMYNDFKEIDYLLDMLYMIVRNKDYYVKKYSNLK